MMNMQKEPTNGLSQARKHGLLGKREQVLQHMLIRLRRATGVQEREETNSARLKIDVGREREGGFGTSKVKVVTLLKLNRKGKRIR